MARVENALKILNILLESDDIVQSKELAKKINVCDRQLRAYLEMLKGAGFNIGSVPGPKGGYFLKKSVCPVCKQSIEKNR